MSAVADSDETAPGSTAVATDRGQDVQDEFLHAKGLIVLFIRERCAEYRELCVLREIGWSNPSGDHHFERQRRIADRGSKKSAAHFYSLMQKIGHQLQKATGVFRITRETDTEPAGILDMCTAPGGFLAVALQENPTARALGFSLPVASGGHKFLMPRNDNVELRFVDVTMLAADMSTASITIPPDHPDHNNFVLEQQIPMGRLFDIVLCDGQILRTHIRAAYREAHEATRLTVTQLALGLEHLNPGGTMVILMHKVEAWHSVVLLHTLYQFATVRLFKPTIGHGTRSSFYAIASDVQSQHPKALRAVAHWKKLWHAATFGSEDEYWTIANRECIGVEQMLEEFGDELVRLGRDVWHTQASALAKAPYIRNQPQARGQTREA